MGEITACAQTAHELGQAFVLRKLRVARLFQQVGRLRTGQVPAQHGRTVEVEQGPAFPETQGDQAEAFFDDHPIDGGDFPEQPLFGTVRAGKQVAAFQPGQGGSSFFYQIPFRQISLR